MTAWHTDRAVIEWPVRAHPGPFHDEADTASSTARNIETVSDEFRRIRFGTSDGFRGRTAEALAAKADDWQTDLEPTAGIFADVATIMSSHADELSRLRSEATHAAAKALSVYKLRAAARSREESATSDAAGAHRDMASANRNLSWIRAQIDSLSPTDPNASVLLPQYQEKERHWESEVSERRGRLQRHQADRADAREQVQRYTEELHDWHVGSRANSWISLRRREDELNARTVARIGGIDLRGAADPGWLAEHLSDFVQWVRDVGVVAVHLGEAALAVLVDAIEVVLAIISVVIIVLVIAAVVVFLVEVVVTVVAAAAVAIEMAMMVSVATGLMMLAETAVGAVVAVEAFLIGWNRTVGAAFGTLGRIEGFYERYILGHRPPVDAAYGRGTQAAHIGQLIQDDPGGAETYRDLYLYNSLLQKARSRPGTTIVQRGDTGSSTWVTLSEKDVEEKFRIPPGLLSDPVTGFDATIFQGPDGQVVVAFPGSRQASDWLYGDGVDALIGDATLAVPSQQRQAVELAQAVTGAAGTDNVVFTGHSLGGDLASMAAMETGSPAVTWNAKGVNRNNLYAYGWADSEISTASHQRIINFETADDFLGASQAVTPLANALGTNVITPSREVNPVQAHELDAFHRPGRDPIGPGLVVPQVLSQLEPW